MKILYVTDLDGTLLNTKDAVSAFSIATINQLVEEGMLFTYATARSLVSASVVAAGLSTQIPIIAYNGAFIIEPLTQKILSSTGFTREEADRVAESVRRHGISPLVYSYISGIEKVSWVTARENDGIRRYLSLRSGDRRFRPLENQSGLYDGEIFYFTCIGEKEELMPVYEEFCKDAHYTCTIHQ